MGESEKHAVLDIGDIRRKITSKLSVMKVLV
jgi:hypothetical protein